MRFFTIAAFIAAVVSGSTHAQGVTTGAFDGVVTAQSNGEPLPGAVIAAVHEPTQTRYTAVTRENGRYTLPNVRVGGPYTLTCTMPGFKPQEKQDAFVKLGEHTSVNFELVLDSVEEGL